MIWQRERSRPSPARPRRGRRPRHPRRGVAVLMVVGVMAVMLLVGAVGVTLFMGGLKITTADVQAKRALFCAEAGLAAGKAFFGQNFTLWDRYLTCNIEGSCAALDYPLVRFADPQAQRLRFTVQILDNMDEPDVQDPRHDNDLTVIVQSRCSEPDLPPQLLQEVVTLRTSAAHGGYQQAGGFAGTNNLNPGGP